MKDEYKRRRKAEYHLIRTLPDVDPSCDYTPIHQENLKDNSVIATRVIAQGNELIVASTREWGLVVYALNDDENSAPLNRDSMSEISNTTDDGLIPNRHRTPLWYRISRTSTKLGIIKFIAPGVIGFINPDTPGVVSTWYVRSSQCLESVTSRGVHFGLSMWKISDTEFVIGSEEGHLCFFTHESGCNLQETARIWKAHTRNIHYILVYKDIIVTTSADFSARLWDVETRRRLAVLNHNQEVDSAAISDQYVVTCSWYGLSYDGKGELRIYRNTEGYSLIKIVRYRESVRDPIFLDGGRILCRTAGKIDDAYLPLTRNSLMVVDIENECVLAQLKVGCRGIWDYTILADGRLALVGYGGCHGVVVTLPSKMRKLIAPKTTKELRGENRRICALM